MQMRTDGSVLDLLHTLVVWDETRHDPPGPKMTAFQIMMLSALGAPEMPAGGSAWSLRKSLTRRLRAAVDYAGGDPIIREVMRVGVSVV